MDNVSSWTMEICVGNVQMFQRKLGKVSVEIADKWTNDTINYMRTSNGSITNVRLWDTVNKKLRTSVHWED